MRGYFGQSNAAVFGQLKKTSRLCTHQNGKHVYQRHQKPGENTGAEYIAGNGIVLGNAIREAVGDKKGIKRYGSCILPMDEALVLCAVDLSGRPYLVFDGEFTADRCGDMDTEMAREFFYAVSYGAAMNLHIKVLYGSNNHHIMEAMFKAFAKALDAATMYDERITDVLSTKGTL